LSYYVLKTYYIMFVTLY